MTSSASSGWQLGRTDTFIRTARRFLSRRPHLREKVGQALDILEKDPFDARLRTHGLEGRLQGLHAVRVTYQVRIIVQIERAEKRILLLDIGEHDEVYRR